MDTSSDMPGISFELPLSEAAQAAYRAAVLRYLAAMPFSPGAPVSRSLWVIFIGRAGGLTRAVLPVDDSLGLPDKQVIAGLCDLVSMFISPPLCPAGYKAITVLRRPGPAEISEADAHIFCLVRQACVGRKTVPWTFHVAGAGGTSEVGR